MKNTWNVYDVIIYSILALSVFLVLWPLLNLLSWSLTPTENIHLLKGIDIFPNGKIDFTVYNLLLNNKFVTKSLFNSLFITITSLILNMIFTTLTAYALSKDYLPGRNILLTLIIFTMVFEPSIINEFLVIKKLGLLNSYLSIILYKVVNIYYLILLIRFFKEIPHEYFEAAEIDGASQFQIFRYIVIPLSIPAIMVIGLFYTVAHWNEYFHAMVYLSDFEKVPLQVLLREFAIVSEKGLMVGLQNMLDWTNAAQFDIRRLRAGIIFITIIPILIVYPFILKYFTKGIQLGGIKE